MGCSSSTATENDMGSTFSSVEDGSTAGGGGGGGGSRGGRGSSGGRNKRYAGSSAGGGERGGADGGGGRAGASSSWPASPHSEPINCILPAPTPSGAGSDDLLPGACFTCSDDRAVALTATRAPFLAPPIVWAGHHKRSVSCMVHGARTDVLYSCARDLTIRQWRRSADVAADADADAADAAGSSTSSPCTQVIEGGHDLNITALALSGDETLLCSGSRDTAVCLWDVATGERIVRKKTSRNLVTCMAWVTGGGGGEDANVVVQGSEDLKLRTWDMRDGSISPSQTMVGYVYFPLCIDVSADGRYIATGSKGFDGVGCEVRVWDRRKGQLLCEMQGHRQSTVGCAFLHGGHTQLASVSKDQSIRLWDVGVEGVGREVFNDVGCTGGTFTCLSAAVAGTKTRLYAGSSRGFSVYDVAAAAGGGEGLSAKHVQSWV